MKRKNIAPEPEAVDPHTCCGLPMRRADGGPYEVMCRHRRLLTAECAECRQQHHGVLTYHCPACGKQFVDAPHLAQGHEALSLNNQIR